MKYVKYTLFFLLAITLNVYGKDLVDFLGWTSHTPEVIAPVSDTGSFKMTQDNPILYAMDSLVNAPYFALCTSCDQDQNYNSELDTQHIQVSDAVLKERLEILDHNTPFKLVFNNEVKGFIEIYAYKRRFTTAKVLGMSDMYFPIFEELLDKYNLPLEFKYLAVVESALNPVAKSKAGAMGLWQFMLTTGKIYDLQVSSFEDQRCDPYKATEAACKYFSYLYDIYNDWDLVLAAYNCGPGNVNKAIRRAGNKRNYWELWPHLPKETRGYVPAFIAVNYIMNFAPEHNIIPYKPITAYFGFDTLKINQRLEFQVLAENLNISPKLLRALNPAYKLEVMPHGELHTLYLPVNKIGSFIENEDKIFELSKETKSFTEPYYDASITHYVGKGDLLHQIAEKYHCSSKDIIQWNHLKDTLLTYDQKLTVGFVSTSNKKNLKG